MRYVALLRGINVGGKNKVPMSELRDCFKQLGFTDVLTYINSGNILFSTPKKVDAVELIEICETAIERRFGFKVVATVIAKDQFLQAVEHAPAWWNTLPDTRNEALFVIPPTLASEVLKEMQRNVLRVDRFAVSGPIIFWTLPKDEYGKSVVAKIIGTPMYKRLTIRNANTTKKLETLFSVTEEEV